MHLKDCADTTHSKSSRHFKPWGIVGFIRGMVTGLWLVCGVLALQGESALGARVLVIVPFPSHSHHSFLEAIMRVLTHHGHQVVEYSPLPPRQPIPNHTHIEIASNFSNDVAGGWSYELFLHHTKEYESKIGLMFNRIWQVNYELLEDTFRHKAIQDLLKSNEHFDLVISESTFGQECLLVFGHRFSAPMIAVETFFPWCLLNRYAGNELSIASVPDLTSVVFANEPMSFKDRMLNFVSVTLTSLLFHFKHMPLHEELIKKYVDHPNTPPLSAMVSNVSLYLTNSYPSAINYIRPHTPNIVPIGGINIMPSHILTMPSMTQEVASFMDSARHGVIYFSFGSVVPINVMPLEMLHKFINVFKKLPQKILWKIDHKELHELPKNVMVTKWAPQLSVLAHPNCRLFITHGGLFSSQEAIHAGVPIVGIPFFADQPYNVQFSIHRGVGVKVDYKNISEDVLHNAILTVLNDPKYRENAERLSGIYRDRPLSPAESLVYWVEYVLRHRGAPHLRPVSADLSWYQLALLDVVAAVLTAIIILIIFTIFVLKKVVSVIKSQTKLLSCYCYVLFIGYFFNINNQRKKQKVKKQN